MPNPLLTMAPCLAALALTLNGCGSDPGPLEEDDERIELQDSSRSPLDAGRASPLFAVEDARVSAAYPGKNYGTQDFLRVRQAAHRSFLKFRIGKLGAPVVSARLALYVLDPSPDGGRLQVAKGTWSELSITWASAPAAEAGSVASFGPVKAGSWAEVDVSDLVRGEGEYSFVLESASSNSAYYSSREGSNPPQLLIETADSRGPGPLRDGGAPAGADGGGHAPDSQPVPDGAAPPRPDSGPAPAPKLGIWTSAAELAGKPLSGVAWTTLKSFADGDTSSPDVSNQDDPTNVRVLAAAIVHARTGDQTYRNKVVAACQKVVGTEQGGRTLAWGREAGAYALAADLVGYRTPAFESWLKHVADGAKCSQLNLTLRQMFYKRPNNWGSMAFGSLAAIYAYLGDKGLLADIRNYWVKGVLGPNPGLSYGSDLSWHVDGSNLRIINPKGAVKQGVNIDGIIPDDMRRGGPFTTGTPAATGYPWEHLQGVLMAARILERAGLSIWGVADQAIHRAAYALQVRIKGSFLCSGDDLWQLAFLDSAYGTSWSGSQNVWGAGKNVGFGYVLP